jgi:hypothetical protein
MMLENAHHIAFIPYTQPLAAHVPISLALQDKNHLSVHIEIFPINIIYLTQVNNKKTNKKNIRRRVNFVDNSGLSSTDYKIIRQLQIL